MVTKEEDEDTYLNMAKKIQKQIIDYKGYTLSFEEDKKGE